MIIELDMTPLTSERMLSLKLSFGTFHSLISFFFFLLTHEASVSPYIVGIFIATSGVTV